MNRKNAKPKKKILLQRGKQPQGRHILIVESPESRRAVALNTATFSVGRHPSNSLVLASNTISRHHATFLWLKSSETNEYSFWVADGTIQGKRSRNGVFVNGKKYLLHQLSHGDVIKIGHEIKLRYNILSSNSERSLSSQNEDKYQDISTTVLSNSVKNYTQTLIE